MGRVGNLLLVNGEPRYTLAAHRGEVVRFFLTNAASSRTYNVSFGDAPMKVLASDVSRFEHEERVPSVVLAPAERYIVEARFEQPGRYALVNAVQAINHYRGEFDAEVDTLGMVTVDSTPAAPDYAAPVRDDARRTRRSSKRHRPVPAVFRQAARQAFTLTMRGNGLPVATVQFMNVDTAYYAPVEWVDGMPDMNWLSTNNQVKWIMRDNATGKENMDIDWHVKEGSIVKLADVQRSQVVPSNAAPDPSARPADARGVAERRAHARTSCGRTRCSFRSARRWTCSSTRRIRARGCCTVTLRSIWPRG